MVPPSGMLSKYSELSRVRKPKVSGIGPVSLFGVKFKEVNVRLRVPSHVGRDPERLLPPRLRYWILRRPDKSGILPLRRLLLRSRDERLDILPIDEGIDPLRLLELA